MIHDISITISRYLQSLRTTSSLQALWANSFASAVHLFLVGASPRNFSNWLTEVESDIGRKYQEILSQPKPSILGKKPAFRHISTHQSKPYCWKVSLVAGCGWCCFRPTSRSSPVARCAGAVEVQSLVLPVSWLTNVNQHVSFQKSQICKFN